MHCDVRPRKSDVDQTQSFNTEVQLNVPKVRCIIELMNEVVVVVVVTAEVRRFFVSVVGRRCSFGRRRCLMT